MLIALGAPVIFPYLSCSLGSEWRARGIGRRASGSELRRDLPFSEKEVFMVTLKRFFRTRSLPFSHEGILAYD